MSQKVEYFQITFAEAHFILEGFQKDVGVLVNLQGLVKQKETKTDYQHNEAQQESNLKHLHDGKTNANKRSVNGEYNEQLKVFMNNLPLF